jgi:hypothetical protein
MKLTIAILLAASTLLASNVNLTDHQISTAKPIPVVTIPSGIGGAAAKYSASHITTNTTTTLTSSTSYITSIVVSVTAVGTTEVLKIQDKSGTPKVIYQQGSPLVLGTTTPVSGTTPLIMTGGIDIVTSGGGAATVDVWITYF